MAKKQTLLPEEQARALTIAQSLGFVFINDQERELINLLRYMNYHGRNLVMETALAMRCAHPWRDNQSKQNLHTIHPAGDKRFATPADVMPH